MVMNHDTHAGVDVKAILKDDLEDTCAIVYHRQPNAPCVRRRATRHLQEAGMPQPQPAYTPTSHVLVQTATDRAATPPQQRTCVISADLRPGDRQALLELFDPRSPDPRREPFHGSLSVFPQRYLDDILTGAHGQLALVARDTCHPQNYGK